MSMPPHARAMLDDLFGARDTIDSLIAGIERFYGEETAVTPTPPRPRRTTAAVVKQPESTPWVAPPVIVEIVAAQVETNGHAPVETPAPAPKVDEASPRHRHEAILHAIRQGPPVGLSCVEIVRALYPGVRASELKPLTVNFYSTLQTMVKHGVLVEDSRLYTIARTEGAIAS